MSALPQLLPDPTRRWYLWRGPGWHEGPYSWGELVERTRVLRGRR